MVWGHAETTQTDCLVDNTADWANWVEEWFNTSVDPNGTWFCEPTDVGGQYDLYLAAGYELWRWGSPVSIEGTDPDATQMVIRRIDFDVEGTSNDTDALANVCGWAQTPITAMQAAQGCNDSGVTITPKLIVAREIGTNSIHRLTVDELESMIAPVDEIVFDPPAESNYHQYHVPMAPAAD